MINLLFSFHWKQRGRGDIFRTNTPSRDYGQGTKLWVRCW